MMVTHTQLSKANSTLYKFMNANNLWDKQDSIITTYQARSIGNKKQHAARKELITDDIVVNYVKEKGIKSKCELQLTKPKYYKYCLRHNIFHLMPHLQKMSVKPSKHFINANSNGEGNAI